MDAVIRFSRKNQYKKIYLAGFSLGAAVSLIYASKSRFIDKIITVSAPSDFYKIENQMYKKPGEKHLKNLSLKDFYQSARILFR